MYIGIKCPCPEGTAQGLGNFDSTLKILTKMVTSKNCYKAGLCDIVEFTYSL